MESDRHAWVPLVRYGSYRFGARPDHPARLSLLKVVRRLGGDVVGCDVDDPNAQDYYVYEDEVGLELEVRDGLVVSVDEITQATLDGKNLIGRSIEELRALAPGDECAVMGPYLIDGGPLQTSVFFDELCAHVVVRDGVSVRMSVWCPAWSSGVGLDSE